MEGKGEEQSGGDIAIGRGLLTLAVKLQLLESTTGVKPLTGMV